MLSNDNIEEGACGGVQLKRHNFRWWESFRRLVDIPKMCLLYVSFGGFGRYELPEIPIAAIDAVFFMLTVHGSTSLARGQHALFEPILQW